MIDSGSIKLLMNWDIKPGRDEEFFGFMIREWVPGVTKLGLQPTGSWLTIYSHHESDNPQIMTEGITDDLLSMREILNSGEWKALHEQLLQYVTNYRQKVVRTTGGFQI
ncbi:MAG: hypothetical protein D6737_07535 [Chloroflexi bacterium]|nr:MAG: hypothetical protein CUN54_06950 [Phototrophicales bacterium]RMF80598.1 MAG: hypothetical protein D6737_07535 [Chloroflexota bacterium]